MRVSHQANQKAFYLIFTKRKKVTDCYKEILEILSKTNKDLESREATMSSMIIVKNSMKKLKEYEKLYEEIKAMFNAGNLQSILEVLERSNFTEVINNKSLMIFNQLYNKFEGILNKIQESILRTFDIRSDISILDTNVSLLIRISKCGVIEGTLDRLWSLSIIQTASIIEKGEIVYNELSINKEDDLIHKLKTDIYDRFINKQVNLQREDLSSNFGRYLENVSNSFSGLQMTLKIFDIEKGKNELGIAMKRLLTELKIKMDEFVSILDYRIVNHEYMSIGLANLIRTLRKLYFDNNPVDINKHIKNSIFRILIEYYRHQMKNLLKLSNNYIILEDSSNWENAFNDFFGKYGDTILVEQVFYECKNKSDINQFYQDLLKACVEELISSIELSVKTFEMTQEDIDPSFYITYLTILRDNRSFLEKVYIRILERTVHDEFDVDIEGESMMSIVPKRFDDVRVKYETRYFKTIEMYVRSNVGGLSLSSINEKNLEDEEYRYFNDITKDMKDRGMNI